MKPEVDKKSRLMAVFLCQFVTFSGMVFFLTMSSCSNLNY